MIDFLSNMIGDVSDVITAAIAAAAAVYVASVWWKTKALVPTMTAIILAAVVVWAAGNVDVLEGRVAADSTDWMAP
ncbi:hypothetical protein DVS28_a5063 [Euzebya pacifica]|uniref:Uncharacterized protein n=1 Tax=Euzebya pacifica TaxID=1608957 RepID=A0A346Y5H2_9ACTN|nr:hypothetical protein [Euzebya pacifica]AXV09719.1 hypothetical protein DVS28_a5063 [Euzebya pacifica]